MEGLFIIIGAFLGGGAFKSLIDYIIAKKKNRENNSFSRLFSDIHQIYKILNTVMRETFSNRVLIISSENGGGIPSVDSDLNSSVKYEVYDYPFHSIKEQWQRQRLSGEHLLILREMYIRGKVEVHVDDLSEGSLKDVLKTNEVHHIKLFLITATDKRLYYISLHYDGNRKSYDIKPEERNSVRSSINKLKPLFEKTGDKL